MQDWLKKILDLPLDKFFLVIACGLVLLSFDPLNYENGKFKIQLKYAPNPYLFIPGCIFVAFLLYRSRDKRAKNAAPEKIPDGYRLKFGSSHSISVVTGKIENYIGSDHSAVVLPANTSFDDQCVRDGRSALGSFFLHHFPTGIEEIRKLIRTSVAKACGKAEESFDAAPPGCTILLDNLFGTAFRVIITAVTRIDPDYGITADTLSLVSSVKQIFKLAAQNRISTLTMPVMGTGHGGLDFKTALSLILLQCTNSMLYEGFHQVREAKIIVYDPANEKDAIMNKIVLAFQSMTQI